MVGNMGYCFQIEGMTQDKPERNEMKYKVDYKIWSQIGHTPITNRWGNYCDLLDEGEFLATGPCDARLKLKEIHSKIEHAYKCHFFIPDFPNQNVRQDWIIF